MTATLPWNGDQAPRMNHVRALVADSEEICRNLLRFLLQPMENIEVVDEAASASEATQKIVAHRPDLVFMDVEIPGGNGVELVQGLPSQPFVIFVTSRTDFVLPALELPIVDYLLKPIEPERFIASVLRAEQRILERQLAELARMFAVLTPQLQRQIPVGTPVPSQRYPAQIVVRVRRRVFWLNVADISWIQGASQYCRVHANGEAYVLSRSLASLENELDPQQFFRIHRSAIVNSAYVREIQSRGDGGHHLYLNGGQAVQMSRARRDIRRLLCEAVARRQTIVPDRNA